VVAFAIFVVLFLTGAPTGPATNVVAGVEAGSPAATAGLHTGDRVVAVGSVSTSSFAAISRNVRASHGKAITVTVTRDGHRLTLGPQRTIKSGNRWIWGFEPAAQLE